jgi:hypothetical protein
MIEYLGWISTIIVLLGFFLNAKRYIIAACIAWIVGDIGWVIYDIYISNFSHMTLSFVIILINVYAINNIKKEKNEIK